MSFSQSYFPFGPNVKVYFGLVANLAAGGTAVVTLPGPGYTSATSYVICVSNDDTVAQTYDISGFAPSSTGFSIKNNAGTTRNFMWFTYGT